MTDLVKFSLFSAEIQANLQPFLQGIIERRGEWGVVLIPYSGNANRSGVPAKAASFTKCWLIEGILEEGIDRHALGGHTPSFGN